MILNVQGCAECGKGSGYALYCVPCHNEFRVWVSLTDSEVQVCNRQSYDPQIGMLPLTFARAIEAKLKEKNCA